MLRDLFSLFPAYAGVIPTESPQGNVAAAFPRICGGDPMFGENDTDYWAFSPHMRG